MRPKIRKKLKYMQEMRANKIIVQILAENNNKLRSLQINFKSQKLTLK